MLRSLLVCLGVAGLFAATALAHGGAYRGPGAEIPVHAGRKPEDPPPPPKNGAPAPPPDDKGAGPPGQPDGREGRLAERPLTYESWEFWWAHNKEDILNLNGVRRRRERDTESSGCRGDTPLVTEECIRTDIYPVFLDVLEADPFDVHFDIGAAAALGAASVASTMPSLQDDVARNLIRLMRNRRDETHFIVQESAALGLGLLQSKDAAIIHALCDTLLDERIPMRARAFAALALGLLEIEEGDAGDARTTETFRSILSGREAERDVEVCALIGVGLMGDVAFAPELAEMVRTSRIGSRRLNDLERSFATASLAKIAVANPGTIDQDLVDLLRRAMTGKGRHTTRSAVIALGQIGAADVVGDELADQIALTLLHVAEKLERQAQGFALISLGKMGGSAMERSTRNRIFARLENQMKVGSFTGRPFAALGLGLLGRSLSGEDAEMLAIRRTVRDQFLGHTGPPRDRGALAIALGMLGDREAVGPMIEILENRRHDKKLRGFTAVALGMIGDAEASDAILAALGEKTDRELHVDSAVAAGLLGDARAVERLLDILRDRSASLFVTGSVSLALGAIGDHRAISPLVEIYRDESLPALNRALATVALGHLGDRHEHPILSRLSKDVNYRASVNALVEVLSIL